MAIENSSQTLVLPDTSYTGLALLNLVESEAGFAVFRIALLGPRDFDVPRGTKIVIEKSSEKKAVGPQCKTLRTVAQLSSLSSLSTASKHRQKMVSE